MAPSVVLVADSNDDSRIIYAAILQHGGFAVLEAHSGPEVLEMVPKHMPDAVIAELALPVIDGCEVLRRLKRHLLTRHIHVLIVTADPRPESRRQAVEAQCAAFVLKPCAPRELLEILRNVLDQTLPPALV